MTTVVIMPGGFHPFHAGHLALYNSARRTFPDAEVYVAATNDTSARPFPFSVKEKLAKLAGVEPGHFVQVKSPFRAEEITSRFNPEKDQLIFVRSEKDATKPPQAGGTKKDGSPAYLQPLLGAKKLEPFAKHAYMAYLPTVEFGPGMTSATEIRTAWPELDERRKLALVMSLYPNTQGNKKLANTVVKMLDTAIDSVTEDLSRRGFLRGLGAAAVAGAAGSAMAQSQPVDVSREFQNMRRDDPRIAHNKDIAELTKLYYEQMVAQRGQPMDRREQNKWIEIARLKAEEKLSKYAPGRPTPQQPSAGFPRQGSEYRRAKDIDNFESVAENVVNTKSGVAEATDPKFVGFMNKSMANKVDAPKADPLAKAPDWYKNAPAMNFDSMPGHKKALQFGLKVLSKLDPETKQQLAAKGEWAICEYIQDIAERTGNLNEENFVEEDIWECQDYLSDVFHDPNITSWVHVLTQDVTETKKKAVPSKQRDPGALATRQHISSQEQKHQEWQQRQRQLEKEFYANHPELDDRKNVSEFAPTGSKKDTLFKYAKLWYAADDNEARQTQIENALEKLGWEIGWDDELGVFMVQSGDANGNSYISWTAEDLQGFNENQGWAATLESVKPVAPIVIIQPTKTQPKQDVYVAPQKKKTPAAVIHVKDQPKENVTRGYIQEEPDYIEEKWSEKYKRSINCANPKGFSQRAHCQGRKKK